jgi:REP-associated tyrosine transposase
MGRPGRRFIPGVALHTIQRGNNKCCIFAEDLDYEWYLEVLRRAGGRHGVSIHAFALMATHTHLVVTPDNETAMPRAMQEVGDRYVKYFNRKYGRIGRLWNNPYKTKALEEDRYVLTCQRYIEQNPVRAHIAETPADYRWSSYSILALGEFSDWIVPHPAYDALGKTPDERQQAYREICATPVPATEFVRLRNR